MLNWILKLIPNDYKWSIATKNIAYDLGKAAAGILSWAGAVTLEKKMHITITPDMQQEVAKVVGVLVTGALSWLHDYLQVKYPNATWL